MRRRDLIALVGAAAATGWPLVARAQHAGKVFRLGIFVNTRLETALPFLQPLRDELRRLGYVEGKDLFLEFAEAGGRRERYPAAAAELVRRKVDVIYAPGTEAAAAAKAATNTIPIVALGGDLVELGLAASFARPGGNLTGIDSSGSDNAAKQIELLKRLVPRLSRVATLSLKGHVAAIRNVAAAKAAAVPLDIALHDIWIDGVDNLDKVFDDMARRGIEAVVVSGHPIFLPETLRLVKLALRHRMALSSYYTSVAEAGGLLAYDTNAGLITRRAAIYIDKILKGTAPGDLPIEFATHFKLTINLKTAKALGLEIPEAILNLADRVIE